ncbi:MAG: iron-sulfur cluster assembly scaffold protein [Balneolales bacterium]
METEGTAILIDHFKHPRNKGAIVDADLHYEVLNRKCGDRLSFTVRREGLKIKDIRFEGEGCFYCLASASVACSYMSGREPSAVLEETRKIRSWLAGKSLTRSDEQRKGEELDCDSEHGYPAQPEIIALGEVKKFPMRIACVDLAWKGLEEMLHD